MTDPSIARQAQAPQHREGDPVDPMEAEPLVPQRRGFLRKLAAVVIGAAALLIPLVPGLAVLIDPLRRRGNGTAGEGGFIPVAALASIPADGAPRRFPVIADRVDAWNRQSNMPIGAVYLTRISESEIIAMNVVCPHLGCSVRAESQGIFSCPCHDSEFNATGEIIPITRDNRRTVSPRDMDRLDVRIEAGQVLVRFQNYQSGIREKVPV